MTRARLGGVIVVLSRGQPARRRRLPRRIGAARSDRSGPAHEHGHARLGRQRLPAHARGAAHRVRAGGRFRRCPPAHAAGPGGVRGGCRGHRCGRLRGAADRRPHGAGARRVGADRDRPVDREHDRGPRRPWSGGRHLGRCRRRRLRRRAAARRRVRRPRLVEDLLPDRRTVRARGALVPASGSRSGAHRDGRAGGRGGRRRADARARRRRAGAAGRTRRRLGVGAGGRRRDRGGRAPHPLRDARRALRPAAAGPPAVRRGALPRRRSGGVRRQRRVRGRGLLRVALPPAGAGAGPGGRGCGVPRDDRAADRALPTGRGVDRADRRRPPDGRRAGGGRGVGGAVRVARRRRGSPDGDRRARALRGRTGVGVQRVEHRGGRRRRRCGRPRVRDDQRGATDRCARRARAVRCVVRRAAGIGERESVR